MSDATIRKEKLEALQNTKNLPPIFQGDVNLLMTLKPRQAIDIMESIETHHRGHPSGRLAFSTSTILHEALQKVASGQVATFAQAFEEFDNLKPDPKPVQAENNSSTKFIYSGKQPVGQFGVQGVVGVIRRWVKDHIKEHKDKLRADKKHRQCLDDKALMHALNQWVITTAPNMKNPQKWLEEAREKLEEHEDAIIRDAANIFHAHFKGKGAAARGCKGKKPAGGGEKAESSDDDFGVYDGVLTTASRKRKNSEQPEEERKASEVKPKEQPKEEPTEQPKAQRKAKAKRKAVQRAQAQAVPDKSQARVAFANAVSELVGWAEEMDDPFVYTETGKRIEEVYAKMVAQKLPVPVTVSVVLAEEAGTFLVGGSSSDGAQPKKKKRKRIRQADSSDEEAGAASTDEYNDEEDDPKAEDESD